MFRRRIGRGGLIGAAVRTAVVAGTATAVVGGMQARGAANAQQAASAQAYENQQEDARITAAAEAAVAHQAPIPPAGAAGDDITSKLVQLSTLHAQGVLTDEEFAAAKARALG